MHKSNSSLFLPPPLSHSPVLVVRTGACLKERAVMLLPSPGWSFPLIGSFAVGQCHVGCWWKAHPQIAAQALVFPSGKVTSSGCSLAGSLLVEASAQHASLPHGWNQQALCRECCPPKCVYNSFTLEVGNVTYF